MDKKSEDELQKKENIEKVFTSAFNYCLNFMRGNNDSFNEKDNNPMAQQSFDYGQEMFEFMLQKYIRIRENIIGQDVDAIKNRPYFYQQKIAQEFFELNKKKNIGRIENVNIPKLKTPVIIHSSDTSDSEKSEINESKSSRSRKRVNNNQVIWKSTNRRTSIPYEQKVKAVDIARVHPNWSIGTIKKYSGCKFLKYDYQLAAWKKLVNQGGPKGEKRKMVKNFVYEKYIDAKNNNQSLSTELIRKWAFEATKIYMPLDTQFRASKRWLWNFRKTYNIVDRFDSHNTADQEDLDKLLPKKRLRMVIPDEKKAKAVELARKNPEWSLQRIARNSRLKRIHISHSILRQWARELQKDTFCLPVTMEIHGSIDQGENHQVENQSKTQDLNNVGEEKESPVLPEKNSEKIIGEEQSADTLNENVVEMSCDGKRSDAPEENYRDYPKENPKMPTDFKSSADEIKIFSVHSLAGGPSSITSSSFSQPIRIRIKREPVELENSILYTENMSVPNMAQHRYSVSSTRQMQDQEVIDLSTASNVPF